MRLTRVFMLTTALMLTLVAAMLARNVMQEWRTYRASEEGLQAMAIAYQAMKAAEKASFERGPSNGALGDGDVPDPQNRARLQAARDATDQAMASVQVMLSEQGHPDLQAAAGLMTAAQGQLSRARGQVTRVAAQPRAERQRAEVMEAVSGMFRVVDIIMEAVTVLSGRAGRIQPELTDSLVGARLAAELREDAGRLGSQFTAALTKRKPLGPLELRNIPLLQGRIEQLWRLIGMRSSATATDPRLVRAMEETREHYFRRGLLFVAEVQEKSVTGRPYGLDTAGFAARYVPEMASIVNLRDSMMEVAGEGGRKSHDAARGNLVWNIVIGLAVLLIEIAVFLFIRGRVLKPMLGVTRTLVGLAQGDVEVPAAESRRHDEIGDMQDAARVLKAVSVEKRRLEAEHKRLIGELQIASRTDFLTGLLNRRAFSDAVNQHLATARRQSWPVALIVFDIDHFKAVNDEFGHAVGDVVLQEIAAIATREFRQADALARYGGEEFIALAVNCESADAAILVERVRAAIQAQVFHGPDGKAFLVTASFGLMTVKAEDVSNLDLLFQRADLALYAAKRDGRNRVEVA